jgi:hypothetical protein
MRNVKAKSAGQRRLIDDIIAAILRLKAKSDELLPSNVVSIYDLILKR